MMPAPGMGGMHPPQPLSQAERMAQEQEKKFDSVHRVKAFMGQLKEAFANVMKVAGARLNHLMIPGTEENPPRFDKTLEDFFSLCNQIEMHLKVIHECSQQNRDSAHYVGPTSGKEGIPEYQQYVALLKGQVHFARAVQEVLSGEQTLG